MELFTQAQANKILNWIPYTTTRDWAKAGFFQWHDGPEDGRGKHRLYSHLNLYQIALCDVLIRKTNIKSKPLIIFMQKFFINDSKNEDAIINDYFEDKYLIIPETAKAMNICSNTELADRFFNPIEYNIYSSVINLKLLKDKVDASIKNNLV
jgi:hypothetical protein